MAAKRKKPKGPLTKREKETIICFQENVGIQHLMLKEQVVSSFGITRIRATLKKMGVKPAPKQTASALAFTRIHVLRKKLTVTISRRRYALHQRIKNNFEYDGPARQIILPADLQTKGFDDLPQKVNAAIVELRDKFKYNLQYELI